MASANVATAAGTATAGTDYTPVARTVTLGAADTTVDVIVDVIADAMDEDAETFTVALSDVAGATLGTASIMSTINDDDAAQTISVSDVGRLLKGNSGTTTAHVPVGLSAPSSRTITAAWSTVAGTASVPGDAASASGIVTFLPGETSTAVDITATGDLLDEDDETFTVTLADPTNAALGDANATVTIIMRR